MRQTYEIVLIDRPVIKNELIAYRLRKLNPS